MNSLNSTPSQSPLKVVASSPLPGSSLNALKKVSNLIVLNPSHTAKELLTACRDATALISLLSDPIDQNFLENCSSLKIVSNYAVGYNNIDVATAKRLGILVCHTPEVLTEATAELTWALIFSVSRKLIEADSFVRSNQFKGWLPDLFLGTELLGKTLGIVGSGRIGRRVGEIGSAFGMKVLYDKEHPFEEVLTQSDVLSLHVPLTEKTRHLLTEKEFKRMKPGAILINTARGPVVDERALVQALKESSLGGAGLDVYEKEPELQKELTNLQNTTLLPHLGSATWEARTQMSELACEAVRLSLLGQTPKNRIPEFKND